MWKIQREGSLDIWISNLCTLRVEHFEENCRVYVDYKGYNVAFIMGIWGFENEIQERGINCNVDGVKGDFKSLSYVVQNDDLNLFCDMIYFFLSEHNLDKTLNENFKYVMQ